MTNSEYEQLVEFLGRQFTEIDRGFTLIDQRFETIDQRFATIDQRFAAIDQRLDAMEQRRDEQFREILGHFDQLYLRLERLKPVALQARIEELERRIRA